MDGKENNKEINEVKYQISGNLYIVGGKYAEKFIKRCEERERKSLKKLIENVRKNSKSF